MKAPFSEIYIPVVVLFHRNYITFLSDSGEDLDCSAAVSGLESSRQTVSTENIHRAFTRQFS
jgi:hypothetical protein